MADKTIADYTQISSLSRNDVSLISSGGTTFKATVEQIRGTIDEYADLDAPQYNDKVLVSSNGSKYSTTVQNLRGIIKVSFSTITSLPIYTTNSAITSDMVLFGHYMSNPFAMGSNWYVTTSDGRVEVTGTITSETSLGHTTDLILYLGRF